MNTYIFIAEDSCGNTIIEGKVVADTEILAHRLFWSNLTQSQKEACAGIEYIDIEPL